MTVNRHSFIAFYPSDWVGGTFRLPRLVKSVYFDVCLYTWDKAEKMPATELDMMLMDLDPGQGDKIIDVLVRAGKLERDEDGSVWSPRALAEATKAYTLWEQKSEGGKRAAEARARVRQRKESSQHTGAERASATEPEPSPDPTDIGKASPSLSPAGDAGKPDAPAKPETPAKPKRVPTEQCREVFDGWNEAAKRLGLKGATKMTASREGAIRARIEELGMPAIEEALGALPDCAYVLVEAKKNANWTGIDWFLRPNTIPKINEGSYRTVNGKGASAWRDME